PRVLVCDEQLLGDELQGIAGRRDDVPVFDHERAETERGGGEPVLRGYALSAAAVPDGAHGKQPCEAGAARAPRRTRRVFRDRSGPGASVGFRGGGGWRRLLYAVARVRRA